ncbi:hypothetical protein GCM10017668_63230 [Streptomyces tuirus]|uniref:Uncharacterized protein n=1 Tax=Streptomyces tuirus TaxID=68278 RepID=A0A7G1NS15_9ACTN|nr:hypothetical protein GCM10017668_63230 [Streptomyces tuirus]
MPVIVSASTRSAGGSGGKVPWVRECAMDQASGMRAKGRALHGEVLPVQRAVLARMLTGD